MSSVLSEFLSRRGRRPKFGNKYLTPRQPKKLKTQSAKRKTTI